MIDSVYSNGVAFTNTWFKDRVFLVLDKANDSDNALHYPKEFLNNLNPLGFEVHSWAKL